MNNNYLHLNIYAFSSGVCPYPSKFTALFSHFENFHSGLYQTANFSCQIDYTLGPTNLFFSRTCKMLITKKREKKNTNSICLFTLEYIEIKSIRIHV